MLQILLVRWDSIDRKEKPMTDKDKLVPRTPNEVVVPIGKANLVTTQEKIDEALETASHIFCEQNKEKLMENIK